MKKLKKKMKLKDGTEVTIRTLSSKDMDRSLEFFKALPPADRTYLRRDVTRPEVIKQRLREMKTGKVKRLVAVVKDEIVADGALEIAEFSWKGHVGEVRLIIGGSYQRKGLGMIMARELYAQATAAQVEEIVVRFMRPQTGARAIFRRLGFHEETLFPEYVRDANGKKQDLIVMRCDLKALWQELEEYFEDSDWQRVR